LSFLASGASFKKLRQFRFPFTHHLKSTFNAFTIRGLEFKLASRLRLVPFEVARQVLKQVAFVGSFITVIKKIAFGFQRNNSVTFALL
jgi:hypothetical protein